MCESSSRISIYAFSAVRLLQGSKDFPTFLTNYFGEIDLTIGNEVTKALVDTRATLSVLIPISLTIPPPQSTETMQTVEVFKQPITVSKSLPVPFHLGPIHWTYQFRLVPSAPTHLLGWDFLESSHSLYFFLSEGRNILTSWTLKKSYLFVECIKDVLLPPPTSHSLPPPCPSCPKAFTTFKLMTLKRTCSWTQS